MYSETCATPLLQWKGATWSGTLESPIPRIESMMSLSSDVHITMSKFPQERLRQMIRLQICVSPEYYLRSCAVIAQILAS